MECSDVRAAAAEDEDDMVTFELEAAEALAGLGSRRSDGEPATVSSSHPSQDPALPVQQCCRHISSTVGKCETTVQTAGYPSKGRLKPSSNEAEKEAGRLRRILANRESARQTIRRRQAMYLELTTKAADLSEENQNLKKEKELAVAVYNSLKDKNKFLKAQIKKAETENTQEEPKSSHGQTSTTATNNPPLFLYNQPSLVPCFSFSILPPSDLFPFHCASRPDIMGSSQFLVPPHRDTPPCSHRGQENPMGPVFILPFPWMLPFLAQTTMFPTNDQCSNHMCSSSKTLPHQHNSDFALNQNLRTEASGSGRHIHGAQFTFPPEPNTVSATKRTVQSLSYKKRELIMSSKKPEDVFEATEARRRRKELMILKNTTHCQHHICTG